MRSLIGLMAGLGGLGVVLLAVGALSGVIAGATISHDMTPKPPFGHHYLYGTSGHPELMTGHELGVLAWLGTSVLIGGLGGMLLLVSGFGTTLTVVAGGDE